MASIIRYCTAAPKKQFFTGSSTLDMAYITPNLIVCSMPTSNVIKGWYRIWLKDLLAYLNEKHGYSNWRIWNLQAEQTGYGDEEVGGKIEHYPFPDHNPPPFELLPQIVCSLNAYLTESSQHVAVLHCKAGKGRSGTVASAYLMMKFKMTFDQATQVFTNMRMRPSFGQGISITSQRRYLKYFHDFVHVLNCQYKPIDIYIDEIKVYRQVYQELDLKLARYQENGKSITCVYQFNESDVVTKTPDYTLLKPAGTVVLPADICILTQHAMVVGGTLPIVHSSAYSWFNAFFETYGSAQGFDFSQVYGKFTVRWCDLDGFKGTSKKGSELFDKIEVCWKVKSKLSTY